MKEDYEAMLILDIKFQGIDLVDAQSDLDGERARIKDLEVIIINLIARNEGIQRESDTWERSFNKLVEHTENETFYRRLRNERDHWMNRTEKLTILANNAIGDIPDKLKAANMAMLPNKIPEVILNFLEFCNGMIRELRKRINGR